MVGPYIASNLWTD